MFRIFDSMNRAFSAANLSWCDEPRALPWAGMKQAVGLCKTIKRIARRFKLVGRWPVENDPECSDFWTPKVLFIPAQGNALGLWGPNILAG